MNNKLKFIRSGFNAGFTGLQKTAFNAFGMDINPKDVLKYTVPGLLAGVGGTMGYNALTSSADTNVAQEPQKSPFIKDNDAVENPQQGEDQQQDLMRRRMAMQRLYLLKRQGVL